MKKKGRPAVGEHRQLTRAEVKYTDLKHGTVVRGNRQGSFQIISKKGDVLEGAMNNKSYNKLLEFWDRDTSGKWGKL